MSQPSLYDDEAPSKSQKKRDAEALQALGTELIALSHDSLKKLQLPENLYLAIREAQKITANGAIRRQRQYIGKLMRDIDPEPIREFLAVLRGESDQHTAWLHRLERQRDRLLQDDEALAEFLAAHPDCDVQNLRQLIRNARKEQAESKPPKAYRQLFQLLKSLSPAPGLPQHATASDSDEDNEDNG